MHILNGLHKYPMSTLQWEMPHVEDSIVFFLMSSKLDSMTFDQPKGKATDSTVTSDLAE
jgi:hypothetical protein